MTLLRRCLLIAGLGLVVPVTNCTLITDVDRSLIDDGRGDAATGGTGGSAGAAATGGSGGTGADAPVTNGDTGTDAELDDANGGAPP